MEARKSTLPQLRISVSAGVLLVGGLCSKQEVAHEKTEPALLLIREIFAIQHSMVDGAQVTVTGDGEEPRLGSSDARVVERASKGLSVLADLDRQVDERCNGCDRSHQLADTAQILNRHPRRLTKRISSANSMYERGIAQRHRG